MLVSAINSLNQCQLLIIEQTGDAEMTMTGIHQLGAWQNDHSKTTLTAYSSFKNSDFNKGIELTCR